jgi:cellulose synthase/poly-beta-1,6-N-acetylglucosamine synthase-like glycosyltransferase
MPYSILFSVDHIVFLTCLGIHSFLGTSSFWIAARYLRNRSAALQRESRLLSGALPTEENLPDVLLQVPTFNERGLILRAAGAARSLDWPRSRLHVQILDDSTDAESRAAAQSAVSTLCQSGVTATLVARENRLGFKAGALAAGLARSPARFVAILDADYVPEPDFLGLCMRAMLSDDRIGFVQARCDYLNADEGPITRSQQRILDAHFAVEQAARNWSGHLMPFNGTCGIWRRAAIEDAGGWSSDTLAEDLDLSYRAQLKGWRAQFLSTVAVRGELPGTLSVWRRQQFRWTKGFAEGARKLLPRVWRSRISFKQKLVATIHLASGMLGPLAAVTLVAGIVDLFFGYGATWASVTLLAWSLIGGAILGPALLMVIAQTCVRGSRPSIELLRLPRVLFLQIATALGNIGGAIDALAGRASAFERTPKGADNTLHAEPGHTLYAPHTRP